MTIHIDSELCKGCSICINSCPKNVLEMSDKINKKGFNVVKTVAPQECIKCKLCEIRCPDLAIYVE